MVFPGSDVDLILTDGSTHWVASCKLTAFFRACLKSCLTLCRLAPLSPKIDQERIFSVLCCTKNIFLFVSSAVITEFLRRLPELTMSSTTAAGKHRLMISGTWSVVLVSAADDEARSWFPALTCPTLQVDRILLRPCYIWNAVHSVEALIGSVLRWGGNVEPSGWPLVTPDVSHHEGKR